MKSRDVEVEHVPAVMEPKVLAPLRQHAFTLDELDPILGKVLTAMHAATEQWVTAVPSLHRVIERLNTILSQQGDKLPLDQVNVLANTLSGVVERIARTSSNFAKTLESGQRLRNYIAPSNEELDYANMTDRELERRYVNAGIALGFIKET